MNERVAHVLHAKQSRGHHCHWPGCTKQVPPAMWGCRSHWFRLPANLRAAIWRAYSPGQEERMDPSEEYMRVAREVRRWIESHGGQP